MISFKANITEEQIRIDRLLAQQFTDYTRTSLKRLVDSGKIKLNGSYVKKASTPVFEGDTIEVESFESPERIITQEALAPYKNFFRDNLLHEYEHFFVINKPAGLVIHPSSENSLLVTLSDIIVDHYPELAKIGEPLRPGIIHRLDKDTSGLLLIARTEHGLRELSTLFKERDIKKMYYAVVKKHPEETSGTINLPVERHPVHKRKMTCKLATGRASKTDYEVEKHYEGHSLVKLFPHTGRTHQLRVHMANLGHPILADIVYGYKSKLIKRQALHAHKLNFKFDGVPYEFTCPLPHDMEKLLKLLETSKPTIPFS